MVRKKLFCLITCMVIMLVVTFGCSKKASDWDGADNGGSSTTQMEGSDAEYQYDTSTESKAVEDTAAAELTEEPITNASVLSNDNSIINSNDKIIRRASLEVETQDFDNLIRTISSKINQLGGYIESSNISGTYYYSDNLRSGNIVARVPKDKLDEFIDKVYDTANVVNRQESTENITLQYVDIESHKKALEIEQERLLALLEKVESLEDIITLETRLSSVRYELQSYETQLRTYDNLVAYSTVTLSIQEVERMTTVVEEKKTVWTRIQSGLSDSMYQISESLQNLFVGIVVNLPYLIIWAVIILVVVIICRKYYKKNLNKIKTADQKDLQNHKNGNENIK